MSKHDDTVDLDNQDILDRKNTTIATLRAQLAAAEQQLTTATALLGECAEQWVGCDQHGGAYPTCIHCLKAKSLLTRIRAATKGTHP